MSGKPYNVISFFVSFEFAVGGQGWSESCVSITDCNLAGNVE